MTKPLRGEKPLQIGSPVWNELKVRALRAIREVGPHKFVKQASYEFYRELVEALEDDILEFNVTAPIPNQFSKPLKAELDWRLERVSAGLKATGLIGEKIRVSLQEGAEDGWDAVSVRFNVTSMKEDGPKE